MSALDQQAVDRDRWNALYRAGSHTSLEPDQSFAELYTGFIEPRFPAGGTALDLAGGVGRNALWLARCDWHVVLNELSNEAARLANQNAAHSGLLLETRTESAEATLAWAASARRRFDLILMLFFLDRALFPAAAAALNRGGLLLVKTRTEDHPRFRTSTAHPEYFLQPGELAGAFPTLHTLYASDEDGMAEILVQAPSAAD